MWKSCFRCVLHFHAAVCQNVINLIFSVRHNYTFIFLAIVCYSVDIQTQFSLIFQFMTWWAFSAAPHIKLLFTTDQKIFSCSQQTFDRGSSSFLSKLVAWQCSRVPPRFPVKRSFKGGQNNGQRTLYSWWGTNVFITCLSAKPLQEQQTHAKKTAWFALLASKHCILSIITCFGLKSNNKVELFM